MESTWVTPAPVYPTKVFDGLIHSFKTFVAANISTNDLNGNTADRVNGSMPGKISLKNVFLGCIFILSIAGNSCVIASLRYWRLKLVRMTFFIIHLCFADILVAFLNVLPQIYEFATMTHIAQTDVTCKLRHFASLAVLYLSTYVMLATAIDRYLAICHPLTNHAWNSRKAWTLIFISWTLSLIFCIPQLVNFRMIIHYNKTFTIPLSGNEKLLNTSLTSLCDVASNINLHITAILMCITIYIAPMLLLGYLYGRMCYVIVSRYHHEKRGLSFKRQGMRYRPRSSSLSCEGDSVISGSSASYSRNLSTAKLKTIKLTSLVVVAYFICWTPYIVCILWWEIDPENAPIGNVVFNLALLMMSANSCCNPFIYLAFSSSMLRRLLPCCDRKMARRSLTRRYMVEDEAISQHYQMSLLRRQI